MAANSNIEGNIFTTAHSYFSNLNTIILKFGTMRLEKNCFNFEHKSLYRILAKNNTNVIFSEKGNCFYGEKIIETVDNAKYGQLGDFHSCERCPEVKDELRFFIIASAVGLVAIIVCGVGIFIGVFYLKKTYCSDSGEIFSKDFENNSLYRSSIDASGAIVNIGEMTQENPLFTATETFDHNNDGFQHDFDENEGFL